MSNLKNPCKTFDSLSQTENIKKAWCRATAHPSYQKDWTIDNPSYGQCCVTALIIQDLYGGDICECKVRNKKHYINITPEGRLLDFTAEQFSEQFNGDKIIYLDIKPRTRASLLKSKSVKERYELLKIRLEYETKKKCE